ncbi:MAG TPA: exodeoxyribonuclease VII large subunit, partial [Acidimicrobiales bacterium]|nr:exodeoxyribonuclease VII large subunit [Acidimicrobiales bacterium]
MVRRPSSRSRRTGPAGTPATASAPTLWDDAGDPTWSVPELGEAIGLHLRTAFPDEVWVRGVIRNLNPGRRGGTVWFDLVEPAADGDLSRPPVASLPVVLFDMARRRVNARLTDAGGAVRMTDGTEVRLRGRLTYYERGGRLQLTMSDIDPDFTLGRLAADRDRLLRLLEAEGLLGRQASLPRPLLPLRLGLVTSRGSAAEHDVLDELRRSGIGFSVLRADVRVQGAHAPRSV